MKKLLIILASIVIVFVVIVFAAQTSYETIEVDVSGLEFEMLVADNAYKHAKGLSGKSLDDLDADGMIFLYDTPRELSFWMKDMEFDIDVLWVKDGTIVKINEDVRAPEEGEEPLTMNSSPFEVDMVIELPVGVVDDRGIIAGYKVNLR